MHKRFHFKLFVVFTVFFKTILRVQRLLVSLYLKSTLTYSFKSLHFSSFFLFLDATMAFFLPSHHTTLADSTALLLYVTARRASSTAGYDLRIIQFFWHLYVKCTHALYSNFGTFLVDKERSLVEGAKRRRGTRIDTYNARTDGLWSASRNGVFCSTGSGIVKNTVMKWGDKD